MTQQLERQQSLVLQGSSATSRNCTSLSKISQCSHSHSEHTKWPASKQSIGWKLFVHAVTVTRLTALFTSPALFKYTLASVSGHQLSQDGIMPFSYSQPGCCCSQLFINHDLPQQACLRLKPCRSVPFSRSNESDTQWPDSLLLVAYYLLEQKHFWENWSKNQIKQSILMPVFP